MSSTLNEPQLRAIAHNYGPMLVVAGAGTGKTTVLVERIARLIREKLAEPGEILAVTYTENAAKVMAERVEKLVGGGKKCSELGATTFHAYCNSILHRSKKQFGVVEEIDLYVYLRRRLKELPLEYYSRAASPGQFLESLLEFFSRCHDELVEASDYARYVDELCAGKHPLPRVVGTRQMAGISDEEVLSRCREISAVYSKVEEMLRADNLGTFGHMILRAVRLLQSDAEVLEQERKRARFLLIDEFQDANLAQVELMHLLAGKEQNVFAVGDPDQAIYRFRGASSAAFAEFGRRFPSSTTEVLSENQRSLPPVLRSAYAVVTGNRAAERKPLESGRARRAQTEGHLPLWPPVEVVGYQNEQEEAGDVAEQIERRLREKRPATSSAPRIGVLYRAQTHRENIVRELAARNIAFTVKGVDVLETGAVRDLLACLGVIERLSDAESLFRVAALPRFGLDPVKVREAAIAAGRDAAFETVLQTVPGGVEVLKTAAKAQAAAQAAGMKAAAAVEIALRQFDLDEHSPPVEAFRNFIAKWEEKAITRTGLLSELLEYLPFFSEKSGTVELPVGGDEEDPNVVRLMTVHSAKGMEFDHVFLLRLKIASFPTNYREKLFEFPGELRKSMGAEGEGSDICRQEERRLFYVGMTRARDTLALYSKAYKNRKDTRPQGFARELLESQLAHGEWTLRYAGAYRTALAAAAPATGVGHWMMLAPSARLKEPALSVSLIEAYKTCPLQFKLRRDWNIPGRAAAAMQYGNAIHTVLKDFYDALQQGRPRSREHLLEMFRAQIGGSKFEDTVQQKLYLRDGLRQLADFYDLRQKEPEPDVLQTERSFELKIGRVTVRGRIDRIDQLGGGSIAIIDYKSGSPFDEKRADESLQLSIYAIAARELWQMNPERLVFYNVSGNSAVETCRTPAQLDKTREQVEKVAERIASGDFEATPGHHCRWCAYQRLCPATEQDVSIPIRVRNAEAGGSGKE